MSFSMFPSFCPGSNIKEVNIPTSHIIDYPTPKILSWFIDFRRINQPNIMLTINGYWLPFRENKEKASETITYSSVVGYKVEAFRTITAECERALALAGVIHALPPLPQLRRRLAAASRQQRASILLLHFSLTLLVSHTRVSLNNPLDPNIIHHSATYYANSTLFT